MLFTAPSNHIVWTPKLAASSSQDYQLKNMSKMEDKENEKRWLNVLQGKNEPKMELKPLKSKNEPNGLDSQDDGEDQEQKWTVDVSKLSKNQHVTIVDDFCAKNASEKDEVSLPNLTSKILINYVYRKPRTYGFYFKSKEIHKKLHLGKKSISSLFNFFELN